MTQRLFMFLLTLFALCYVAVPSGAGSPNPHAQEVPVLITLSSQNRSVLMGETIAVTASATRNDRAAPGVEIWTYVNGKRWGAVGRTGSDGKVRLLLPLPNPGQVQISATVKQDSKSAFYVGDPIPTGAVSSNTLSVLVHRGTNRVTPFRDPAHRIGMDWEPWFTPLNAAWGTAEAMPLIGNYASVNRDVIRQHIMWMNATGIDFLLVDWSNNVWGAAHWSDHPPGVDQLVASTNALMETLAQMKGEGLPVPQVTLLLGLINGPPAKMSAVNEELQFVHNSYIAPLKYRDLWVTYEGKPLVTVLDTLGPDYLKGQPPIDQTEFTIRWMSTLLEHNNHAEGGFWSWMDGVIHPIATRKPGATNLAEALTITPAFFGSGGWTYPAAMGRRGGATYVEQFRYASEVRPTFLLINQWNEFAGQPIGQGTGPNHDQYVDTYNVPLSDDIEPTSLTEEGYRGGTGWGFAYQNLTRALIRLYTGQNKRSVVLAVASPEPDQKVTGTTMPVQWSAAGPTPGGFAILLDGRPLHRHLQGNQCEVSLVGAAVGRHTVTVNAEGASTLYPISPLHEDHNLRSPAPASVTVGFWYAR